MIPLKLNVKNFMCYRDNVPTLDLENIHVACLCGQNGHGKTALLDAMTWALWGESRARTHDELVHQGAMDMAVELEFLARGQRHRVSRRYARGAGSRSSSTLLEHHVSSNNGFRAVTGNTVRETEADLKELLHMDYETFVNTAFLLQGRADNFTTSTPSKRKERLAEVLDLHYYEFLEGRAKERSQAAQDRVREVDSAIMLRRQEIANRADLETRLASANQELERIVPAVESERSNVERLRATVDSLESSKGELDSLNSRLETSRSETAGLERQLEAHRTKLADYERTLADVDKIKEQFEQLKQARTELDRLQAVSLQVAELDRQRAQVEQTVAVKRERISSTIAQFRDHIAQRLEPMANRLPSIEGDIAKATQEQAGLDKLEASLELKRSEQREAAARVQFLEQSSASLRSEMEETRKKFDILEKGEPNCPVCRQPLGAEGQEHLRGEYANAGQDAKRRYSEHESERKTLTAKCEDLSSAVFSQEAELKRLRQDLESRLATQQRDEAEAQQATRDLEPARGELAQKTAELEQNGFAEAEIGELSGLETKMAALRYDPASHEETRRNVARLEPAAELHGKLAEATRNAPDERAAVEGVGQILDGRREQIEHDMARRTELSMIIEVLPSKELEFKETLARFESLEKERQDKQVEKRVIEERLSSISEKEREVRELEVRRRQNADEKAIYDELTVAFGKNGVQALIIEMAIPQLQDEANEILARLTENRMALKLQLTEGRRERRMGLPSEELEIKISDEVGTRSYETFSGGEAFRINFALRIALSKLLARRSGAPLPILFIDEGFGSQDAAGQERLKEAIQSIQADFQKIIVITHVEEVKESFPVRIEVTKTSAGSTFAVV